MSNRARLHTRHGCRYININDNVSVCFLPLVKPRQICFVKDVVLVRSLDSTNFVVGEALRFGEVEDLKFAFVCLWDLVKGDSGRGAAIYQKSSRTTIVDLRMVLASVTHSNPGVGVVRVLIPFAFQGFRAVAE